MWSIEMKSIEMWSIEMKSAAAPTFLRRVGTWKWPRKRKWRMGMRWWRMGVGRIMCMTPSTRCLTPKP